MFLYSKNELILDRKIRKMKKIFIISGGMLLTQFLIFQKSSNTKLTHSSPCETHNYACWSHFIQSVMAELWLAHKSLKIISGHVNLFTFSTCNVIRCSSHYSFNVLLKVSDTRLPAVVTD